MLIFISLSFKNLHCFFVQGAYLLKIKNFHRNMLPYMKGIPHTLYGNLTLETGERVIGSHYILKKKKKKNRSTKVRDTCPWEILLYRILLLLLFCFVFIWNDNGGNNSFQARWGSFGCARVLGSCTVRSLRFCSEILNISLAGMWWCARLCSW